MANLDAATVAQNAVRLGLATPDQMQECRDEVGKLGADPAPLIRTLERKGYLTPYQSQKLLKGDKDGYLLGGYRLLYLISAGSFGRVFRGDDPRTGTVVAVKVLRRRFTDNPHHVELFEREGKVGLTLRHPNIVSILAVSRDQATKQYYIVMEFVEGGNLRDILRIRKKLEPAEGLRLLEDTVAGMAYSFSRGVTHRDIKPTNILVSAQGQAKLVDFGLAGIHAAQGGSDGDQADRTVDYAGLEKATGVKSGDVRSDIYFLGCVFYEMLTGRSPLDMTKDKQARMQRQRFDQVQPIRPEEVNGPESVLKLVERMMSLNPQQRYQTPSQLLAAVGEVRREVDEEKKHDTMPAERSVFLLEKKPRLQEPVREKLKELGYDVFVSNDPEEAVSKYREKPYDVLVVDASSLHETAVEVFNEVLSLAESGNLVCVGFLLLAEGQAAWAEKVPQNQTTFTMVSPIKLKTLYHKVVELAPPS